MILTFVGMGLALGRQRVPPDDFSVGGGSVAGDPLTDGSRSCPHRPVITRITLRDQ